MATNRKAIIEKVNDAFARGDVEGFLSFCADDLSWSMVGHEPAHGKDAVRKSMASGPTEPPNFTVDTVLADGDHVTAIGTMTMKKDGVVVPYAYCDVWRFRGDQIVELRAFVIKTAAATA